MPRRFRIAIGGIRHEANTFSPIRTGYGDFHIFRGRELLDEAVRGVDGADQVDFAPLFGASALPSGPVTREAYLQLKDELLAGLRDALPVDGVYLDLHGAMEVEGVGDGESDLIASVRAVVGTGPLISVSLDLHGNISPELVDGSDVLTALRTAPHRDGDETRSRALANLLRALGRGVRPAAALVKVPLLLPGEAAMTDVEPARSLYARLLEIERTPAIIDASLLVGCAWTDGPFTSASVIVVAEEDAELARRQAVSLARDVWEKRAEFSFGQETATIDGAIRAAMGSPAAPVYISDSGDNVTAGAAGDLPVAIGRLLVLGAQGALVAGLRDPESVRMCAAAGEGSDVDLAVGGKLDRAHGGPLPLRARVTGLIQDPGGRIGMATVQVRGVTVVLTVDRRLFLDRASIAASGVNPGDQRIVVVKQGYLFPDLADHAPRAIMALTPGASDLRIENLPYEHIRRPIYPLDGEFQWEP